MLRLIKREKNVWKLVIPNFKTSYVTVNLLQNQGFHFWNLDFKTSYVTVNPYLVVKPLKKANISKHLMLRLIFKNAPLFLRSKKISKHLMLRLITLTKMRFYYGDTKFKTSYVTVNQNQNTVGNKCLKISKHLMLRLIRRRR